jgi:hypothetical protein
MASPGVVGNPNWKKGCPPPNPAGRPKTKPTPLVSSRVTREIFEEANKRGYKHPVIYMLEVMHDPNVPAQRRDTMAACAAPWMTPKYGKDERFVDEAFQVPTSASVEDAQRFLDELPKRVRDGELDFASAQEFSILVTRALQERRLQLELELKRLNSSMSTEDTTIRIEGGLPQLPGTNITMPHQLNGNGHGLLTIDNASPDQTNSSPDDRREVGAGPPDPSASNP